MKNKKLISKEDKIYVAGHRGMAGSAIINELRLAEYKNIITLTRQELDLTNELEVKNWFKENKPDVVVLAAAKVGGIEANNNDPTGFLLENLKIQNNVIESSWKNNSKRLLFLGSSCIYPKFANQPIKEEELMSGYLEPTNASYALAKIAGLRLCKSLRNQYGFDAISLMPTNLYGPGDNYDLQNGHVLPALIRKFYEAKINKSKEVVCWGTGSPYREFLHVDDLGKACLFALENWDPDSPESPKDNQNKPLTYLNVGTGKDMTIKDLALLIAEIVQFNGEIIWDKTKPDGTPRKQLSISRIKAAGWEPQISINEGLKSTIEVYKKLKN